MTPRELVNEAANRAWCPPPTMSVWEWADSNIILGADSPEPGQYRTSRTPYVRQVMDCLSPSHPARHIAIMKGGQTGLTRVGLNWLGFTIDLNPAPVIITLPSEGVAKEWSNQRLAQLVEETPCLRGKIHDTKSRSGNSIFLKRIFGTAATIKIAWSSSAKKLASTSAAFLLSDEVDRFEGDVDGEGDPLQLLDVRMENFPRGKHFKISTPTHTPSRIEREFLRGDRRYYFLPCPFCGHFQHLDFHRLRWPKRPDRETPLEAQARYEQAAYHCLECEQRVPERFKTQMLHGGIWVATVTAAELLKVGFSDGQKKELARILGEMESAEFVSFHLSSLYKPLGWKGASWMQLARDWEAAHDSVSLKKGFINTRLGEVWQERGEAPDSDVIHGKRDFYNTGVVPRGGLFLTMAVDQQRNPPRLEWEIKAWGRGRECWSVAAGTIAGDPGEDPVWRQLDILIQRDWPHESGGTLPIWAAAIDTGWNPQKAYDFCARYAQPEYGPAGAKVRAVRTVVPIKGGHDWQRAIEGFSSIDGARKREGLRIITLGTAYLKQEVYNGIRRPKPEGGAAAPGYWHYPNYAEWWFQGLCSESVINGKWVWDKRFRNEPLDLGGYNLGMAELCEIGRFVEADWADLERKLQWSQCIERADAPQQEPPTQRRVLKSSWLQR